VLLKLTQAAPFERLRELRLRGNVFGDDARAELFNSDLLCGVQALELGQNSLDTEAMCVLAGSTKVKHLQRLGLEHNPLGDEGARALASAEHLGALKHLNVASCKIERDGARALSKARFFGQLESLAFGSSMQQAEGILVNKLGPNIRNLELHNSLVSGKTIERLTRRKDTPTLETLCLKHCNLYPDDFEKIATSAYLKRLRKIDMRLCYGAGEYVPAMLRFMPHLSELDLFNCHVNVDELDAILSCPEFHQMRSLDLAFNGFGDQGALLIANAPLTANLTSLLLYDRSITELGWSALIESPYLAESIKKKFQAMKRRHT
jgi:Ran GTPase-activating protein (RanGAP) involved in mRNA processing and transport